MPGVRQLCPLLGTGVDAKAAGVVAKGIDVSMYQEAINWSAVASEGYSFAFIRVGSAKSGLDPYFAQNMVGAAAAGLKQQSTCNISR